MRGGAEKEAKNIMKDREEKEEEEEGKWKEEKDEETGKKRRKGEEESWKEREIEESRMDWVSEVGWFIDLLISQLLFIL